LRERFFAFPSVDRNSFKTHLLRVLNTEVSQAADAMNRDAATG
jgi:hypothetical protein